MPDSLSIDFNEPVPLFPLPNGVLLPHITVRLHIFEARYRQMTRDALASQSIIAMASFEGEEWKKDYEGTPPLRPFVCVGHVMRHEQLADGRYNLMLQGVCRARIVEEIEHDPYRMALLEPIEPQPTMEIDLTEERERIEELLHDPMLKQLASVNAVNNWLSQEVPTPVLIDLAITAICNDQESLYRMLAEPDAMGRADWLTHQLRGIRKTLTVAQRMGDSQSPDGEGLN